MIEKDIIESIELECNCGETYTKDRDYLNVDCKNCPRKYKIVCSTYNRQNTEIKNKAPYCDYFNNLKIKCLCGKISKVNQNTFYVNCNDCSREFKIYLRYKSYNGNKVTDYE